MRLVKRIVTDFGCEFFGLFFPTSELNIQQKQSTINDVIVSSFFF